MPTPRKNEAKKKFISRCVPIVIEDGTAKNNKQALAVCNSLWKNRKDREMSSERKKRKQRALDKKAADEKGLEHLGRVKAEALKLAEEPMADAEAEVLTDEEVEEIVEVALDDGDKSKEDMESEIVTLTALVFDLNKELVELKQDDDEDDAVDKILNFLGLDEVAKRRMTRASINDLPDSAFAFIEGGGKKDAQGKTVPRSLRHYPIHDAAHVRNALARAAQMIKRGGKSATVAKSAMSKIRAAAKKLKIGKASGFIVQKDLEGNYRWFGWVSNQFRDRDFGMHPKGEIIAEAAHKEFIEYVDADPKNRMPALWIWHTPRTAMKMRADWIDYADGFLLESGPLTEKEGVSLEALGEKHDLAMSHGFFKDVSTYDQENGVVNKYRQIEASVLPRDHVANEWTDFATLQEVKDMFTPERREFLVDALGEEKVAELESSTKDMSEELKALGIEFKELEEEKPEADVTKEKPKAEDEDKSVKVSFDADELIEKIGLPALSEYLESQDKVLKAQAKEIAELKALKEQVDRLTKTDDEKIAEMMSPKVSDQLLWLRPSESEETELKEGDELAESKPAITKPTETGWITEALTGNSPVASAEVPKS